MLCGVRYLVWPQLLWLPASLSTFSYACWSFRDILLWTAFSCPNKTSLLGGLWLSFWICKILKYINFFLILFIMNSNIQVSVTRSFLSHMYPSFIFYFLSLVIHLQVFPNPRLCKYSSMFHYILLPSPSKILV